MRVCVVPPCNERATVTSSQSGSTQFPGIGGRRDVQGSRRSEHTLTSLMRAEWSPLFNSWTLTIGQPEDKGWSAVSMCCAWVSHHWRRHGWWARKGESSAADAPHLHYDLATATAEHEHGSDESRSAGHRRSSDGREQGRVIGRAHGPLGKTLACHLKIHF